MARRLKARKLGHEVANIARRAAALTSMTGSVVAVTIALTIGGLVILLFGKDPLDAYLTLLKGAFVGRASITETLLKAIPLALMGLAISVAFRGSFWNIGGEGQFLAGAILSTWVALNWVDLPTPLLAIAAFLAGFSGGAVWCWIAAQIKVLFNVNDVISTIMLNYIAAYGLIYLIRGPMLDPTQGAHTTVAFPQSATVSSDLFLPDLILRSRLHWGAILPPIVAALIWLLWRTRVGFEIETVGASKETARYAGMKVARTTIIAAILSGGLAGLVGWSEVFGVHHRLLDEISGGYGYLGIVVALLGGLNPWGILTSAVFLAGLSVGGSAMERSSGVSFAIVDVIYGVVILFLLLSHTLGRRIEGRHHGANGSSPAPD